MHRPFFIPLVVAALGSAACAANGDPPPGSNTPGAAPPNGAEATPAARATAPSIESRDVAILVLEQTASSLRVTSSARRPRSSFGPAASWNGTGTATHAWKLVGTNGETLASGAIVARGTLESPPNPAQGAPGANVPKETLSFTVKVPQPEPGETIEIGPAAGPGLTARWP